MNSLEDLKEINLGQLSFSLPDNLDELQDSLGGEGACVQVGYSLISTTQDRGYLVVFISLFLYPFIFSLKVTLPPIYLEKIFHNNTGVPTASLAFFLVNCQNGTWYFFFVFLFVFCFANKN